MAALALIVAAAYVVFGLTGFGATMFAIPMLALLLPLKVAVPLMLLFDLVATASLGLVTWRRAARGELLRLVPLMLLGQLAGLSLLVGAPAQPLLVALGLFVLANAAWNLFAPQAGGRIGPWWSVPAGTVGGVFSALFGTGGPIYATYLARRIPEMADVRATSALLILASALIRLVLYVGAGLYRQPGLMVTALVLMPFCVLGLFVGSRLHAALPGERVKRVLFMVLALGGVLVIWKGVVS